RCGRLGSPPPTVSATALSYVALRMLGAAADDPLVEPARRWLRAQPAGVWAIPTWGKFWLAFLGLYDYAAIQPCPPELFLMPRWLPFHPSRLYCHTRSIYRAMAFLYGRRFRADLGPLASSLRQELYGEASPVTPDFLRNTVATTDLFVRPHYLLRAILGLLAAAERVVPPRLRARALERCLDGIVGEQRATKFQALSPVNGLLDCLVLASSRPAHVDLEASLDGLESWKWSDPERGGRYAGARSNAWDTAFAMQALLAEGGSSVDARRTLAAAYAYLRDTQLSEELDGRAFLARDSILGGWCFSDGAHRWPVSDCTAEAVSAILAAHTRPDLLEGVRRIGPERLKNAVEFILERQNGDGGFATYERRRGPAWLESFNPSEMFGNCMTEGSYVECTGSCLDALARYVASYPGDLDERVRRAIERGQR